MKVYWLTGLPCSGKTTIANELAKKLGAEVLDGDILRELTQNNDFSKEGRIKHMKRVAITANLLSKYTNVVVALVSPIREIREEIKRKYGFFEIFISCNLDECKRRDVKGMYAKALCGEIENFTGIQDPYEEPLNPDVIVDTKSTTVEQCVSKILSIANNNANALLIGRWQPLHQGHNWLIDQVSAKGYNVILGIRNTPISENNPYNSNERIKMIKDAHGNKIDYIVIPDLGAVFYGRDVGYKVEELIPPAEIGKVSATEIRRNQKVFK